MIKGGQNLGLKRFPQMESGAVTRVTNQTEVMRITFTENGIGGASDHLEELDAIRSAQEGDTVALYFTGCPGGNLDTGYAIMNAILTTKARVVAIMEGHNASLATMIPLVCDEVVVTPFSSMMLHTANTGAYGTVGNVERYSVFASAQVQRFIREIYAGFATEEEILRLLDGSELYLDDTSIQERLTTRAEKLLADLDEVLAEIESGKNVAEPDITPVAPVVKTARKKASKK